VVQLFLGFFVYKKIGHFNVALIEVISFGLGFSPKTLRIAGTIAAVSNIVCSKKRKMQGNSKMGIYHFQTSYI
jgi:hypothetical protein